MANQNNKQLQWKLQISQPQNELNTPTEGVNQHERLDTHLKSANNNTGHATHINETGRTQRVR